MPTTLVHNLAESELPTVPAPEQRRVFRETDWVSAFLHRWKSHGSFSASIEASQDWPSNLYPFYGTRDPLLVADELHTAGCSPPPPDWERIRGLAEDPDVTPTVNTAIPPDPQAAFTLPATGAELIKPGDKLDQNVVDFATAVVVLCAAIADRSGYSGRQIREALLK
jgi:hypothetical protein